MDKVTKSRLPRDVEYLASCAGEPGLRPHWPQRPSGPPPQGPRIGTPAPTGRRILVFSDRPPGTLPTPAPTCDLAGTVCLQQTIQYHLAETWDILNPDCSRNRCLTSYPIPYQPSDRDDPRFVNVRQVIADCRDAYQRLYQLVASSSNNPHLTREMSVGTEAARELLKRLQLQVFYMPRRESEVRTGFQMLGDLFNTMANLIEATGPARDPLLATLRGLIRGIVSYNPDPNASH